MTALTVRSFCRHVAEAYSIRPIQLSLAPYYYRDGYLALTFLPFTYHMSSIGFRFGEQDGHCKPLILLAFSRALVERTVWTGAPSRIRVILLYLQIWGKQTGLTFHPNTLQRLDFYEFGHNVFLVLKENILALIIAFDDTVITEAFIPSSVYRYASVHLSRTSQIEIYLKLIAAHLALVLRMCHFDQSSLCWWRGVKTIRLYVFVLHHNK